MSKIDVSQFLGKSKEYEIMGKKVEIEPLKGKDIDLLFGIKEGNEMEGVKKLIMATFELTQAEFDELPVEFVNKAAECIIDANGLERE